MLALRYATETTAQVWYKSATAGVLSLSCNGSVFTGDTVDPLVENGTGIVEATGLSANTKYPFTLMLDGVEVDSGTLRTMPAAGSTFTIGYSSCWHHLRDSVPTLIMPDVFPDLVAFQMEGDNIYACEPSAGGTVTVNGYTLKGVEYDNPLDQATTVAQLRNHYDHYLNWNGVARMMRAVPTYGQTDDHERPGNAIAGPNLAEANYYTTWATTKAEIIANWGWCRDVFHEYYKGNPPNAYDNNDASFSAQKQLYYDYVIGDVHCIVLERFQYASDSTDVDGPTKTRFGATQFQWLQDRCAAVTTPFRVIFLSSPINNTSVFATTDGDLFTFLATLTGTIIATGDVHMPQAYQETNTGIGIVCASPAAAGMRTALPDGYITGQVYKSLGYYSNGVTDEARQYKTAGFITVHGSSYMDVGLIDDKGNKRYTARIYPGSNQVQYPQVKFG